MSIGINVRIQGHQKPEPSRDGEPIEIEIADDRKFDTSDEENPDALPEHRP